MTYAATGRIKVYPLFLRKIFYVGVFLEVLMVNTNPVMGKDLFGCVLDVVVEGHHDLPIIQDFRRANSLESRIRLFYRGFLL